MTGNGSTEFSGICRIVRKSRRQIVPLIGTRRALVLLARKICPARLEGQSIALTN
jgi:hypothetical protein